MRVLMVGNRPDVKGGISSVIEQLLSYDWKDEGVELSFIPTYIGTNAVKKILFFLKSYIKIRKKVRGKDIDVVYMHMSYRGSFFRKFLIHKLCRKCNIKDVVHLHGSEFEKWYYSSSDRIQNKVKHLLREVSSFIVLGRNWENVIKRIEPTCKTIVVGNAVHIPSEVAQWSNNPFKILFLGVLIKRKGVEDLIKAAALIKERDIHTKYHFIIAGTGEEESNLKKEVEDFGLNDCVEFIGWVRNEDKESLLKSSQLFVLPSYNEGLPVAILEAISYGLPVVSTNVGDISSAVIDKANGYLIEPGDVDELCNKIVTIANDKHLFSNMSVESRKLAANNFSDELYFKKIKQTLLKCNN